MEKRADKMFDNQFIRLGNLLEYDEEVLTIILTLKNNYN